MDLEIRTQTVGDTPVWIDSEQIRYVTGGVTVDRSTVRPNGAGKRIVKSGTPMGRLANGKSRRVPATVLAAAAAAGGNTIDVDDASAFVDGDRVFANEVVTIAANGVAIGGGAGGKDRITLTGNLANAHNLGDDVATQDGSADAYCLLWRTEDVTERDKHSTGIDHARVRLGRLPVTLTARVRNALALVGITFRP